jgi:putative transposase
LWRRPLDADLLREMIGFAAQRLMELEVESLTGAGVRGRRHVIAPV